ncbi:hypothetical protein [Candidatus Nitrotoga sp. 1052]|uniref:hypothetical protein n=1 Tax=Candidatus Nitrotoga sp. 1052 TaxID=2886964 RepID=UPI001EF46BE1|nr:hypothetical protein [Candidatus Nitrotoga sp. 1052]CAH1079420.1 conserved exported hypothetical protein [Candidatus Nitrotoga sp. 1052]
MTIKNFLKLQFVALLFAAIISPLSSLADTNSKPATIKFILGTKEVLDYQKTSCPPYYLGSTITGIGTGTITENRKSTRLGVLSFKADDCITPMENYFTSTGSWTLTARNGNSIMGNYSVSFVPTDNPQIYMYENFILQITGGTGLFTGATGSGVVEGASNIQTGLGVIEGTMYISK